MERTPSESTEKDYITEDVIASALKQLEANCTQCNNINLALSASSICSYIILYGTPPKSEFNFHIQRMPIAALPSFILVIPLFHLATDARAPDC